MPFLIIIAVGVIVVLLFNLWKSLFGNEPHKAAYMHFVDGSAQMKAWGTEEFFNLNSDAVVMEGDEILTSANAEVIMEFFDGTIMRVDGATNFKLDAIDDESNEPVIEVTLKDGSLWFNRLYKDTGSTLLSINVDGVNVDAAEASVFELENNKNKVVRVFKVFDDEGLRVDIMDEAMEKVVESENVGVGQQIIFTEKVLAKYWQHNSPSVISAVSDPFKEEPWYVWNMKEDKSPTQFEKQVVDGAEGFKVSPPKEMASEEEEVKVGDETVKDGETDAAVKDEATKPEEDKVEDQPVSSSKAAKPTIASVAGITQVDEQGFYRVTSRVATLTGSVAGATKVFVNGYELKKFKAGDSTWTYYANYDFELMKEGENSYEIYSLDAEGNKSETLLVKVFYTKQDEAKVEPTPAPTPTPESSTTETAVKPE